MAVISFKTEVLTPIESDQIRSQILSKLCDGYVAFDVEKGRINTKEQRWNGKAMEYAGADSFLQYNARTTEKLIGSDDGAVSKDRQSELKITRPNDDPIIRK